MPRKSSRSSSASAAGVRRPRSGSCGRSRYPSGSTRPGSSCRPARTTRRSTRSSCRSPRPSTGRWPAVAVRTLHANRRRRPGSGRPVLREQTRAGSWAPPSVGNRRQRRVTETLCSCRGERQLVHSSPAPRPDSCPQPRTRLSFSARTPTPGVVPRRGCRAIRRGAPGKARTPLRRGRV